MNKNTTHCRAGHVLDEKNTYLRSDDLYKDGIARKCRACSNARGREYRLRRKLKGAAT